MAHFIRFLKAKRLKNKWKCFQEEKTIGLNADENETEHKCSRKNKLKHKSHKWWPTKLTAKIKTQNTIENIVWKSFLGFVGGVSLTCVFFFFFHIGVNISLRTSTYVCALAGMVLSIGLAFSSEIRCYVLLLLSAFFSKQGRQALLTYALFLSFTGPGRNTMHNMEILSDSMTCGQEMVRRTLKQTIDLVQAPIKSLKENMQKLVKGVEEAVELVRKAFIKITRIIICILKVTKKVTRWLKSIVNLCNKKIGTPFQRCMRTFDEAIADCTARLGVLDFLCHVVHIAEGLCYTVKWLDFICLFTEFASDKVVGSVRRKLRQFNLKMKNLFYVSIEFSNSYEFETTCTNTTKEVTQTILQKLSKKMEKLQTIFSYCGFVFSLLFVILFIKVYYYRYKYLSSDRYDNVYISNYIVDLDLKRAETDRETVLPLEPREKRLYAKPTAFRLLKEEKSRIADSMFLLSLTSFKIITFLVVDYGLFWILMMVYEAGRNGLDRVEVSRIGIHVEGKGILADFYRKLGETFQVPENPDMRLTPLHCLPDPIEPDTVCYIQIGFLVALCWILTVTEAYGLRLRNVVMSHYYPDRARERAIWLYNHIIRSRASFVRYARRQLRRKFGNEIRSTEKVTMAQRLFADFPLLGAIFGKNKDNNCMICLSKERESQPLKRCRTPDCRGRYCFDCFASLENVCTICQHPVEYGDISDVSEEMDSSEEDLYGRTYKRTESESGSDHCQESDEFLTFKEMEKREQFRDVEANILPDYAKLGDLYSDKAALQKRLKIVIQKHLLHIERERERMSQKKERKYKQIRARLKDALCKLKNKKLNQIVSKRRELKQKFLENIQNLKTLRERGTNRGRRGGLLHGWGEQEEEAFIGLSRKKKKISFKIDLDEEEEEEEEAEAEADSSPVKSRISAKIDLDTKVPVREPQDKYMRLKNELKAKIEFLKRRKATKRGTSFVGAENLA